MGGRHRQCKGQSLSSHGSGSDSLRWGEQLQDLKPERDMAHWPLRRISVVRKTDWRGKTGYHGLNLTPHGFSAACRIRNFFSCYNSAWVLSFIFILVPWFFCPLKNKRVSTSIVSKWHVFEIGISLWIENSIQPHT